MESSDDEGQRGLPMAPDTCERDFYGRVVMPSAPAEPPKKLYRLGNRTFVGQKERGSRGIRILRWMGDDESQTPSEPAGGSFQP